MYCSCEFYYDNNSINWLYQYCDNKELFKGMYSQLVQKAHLSENEEYALFDGSGDFRRLLLNGYSDLGDSFTVNCKQTIHGDRYDVIRNSGSTLSRKLYFCTSGIEILEIVKELKSLCSLKKIQIIDMFYKGEYIIYLPLNNITAG